MHSSHGNASTCAYSTAKMHAHSLCFISTACFSAFYCNPWNFQTYTCTHNVPETTVYHQCHGNTNTVQCVFRAQVVVVLFTKVSIWIDEKSCSYSARSFMHNIVLLVDKTNSVTFEWHSLISLCISHVHPSFLGCIAHHHVSWSEGAF